MTHETFPINPLQAEKISQAHLDAARKFLFAEDINFGAAEVLLRNPLVLTEQLSQNAYESLGETTQAEFGYVADLIDSFLGDEEEEPTEERSVKSVRDSLYKAQQYCLDLQGSAVQLSAEDDVRLRMIVVIGSETFGTALTTAENKQMNSVAQLHGYFMEKSQQALKRL